MESKKQPVPETTITRDISKLSEKTGNVYKTVMIVAQRANQIASDVKKELNSRLEEFSNFADTLEETFENREQIEISRYYERQPKPTLIAIKEFEDEETYYKQVEEPKE
ncbi:MAG: DNA-directed RNA polymerase subunit omega [Bacteroidales bacterium]|jgi:DNA-directed RNA polymerase subunit K/omega|nr:DNA-directed RNA polymerase subunit omega [Bacteroidales bacterium]MDD2264107.1 DNA-directed RNA polymerase subunit omega [Bacteroidales bacterium]MDD2831422.1 DNA-directed RNA polymerase subunit omega [Bacteroidales bacterium]MDD3208416.1 DNA-directed RNA polymerase subunit omega [Bacteroidales bacterium]MDD3696901.1 DNA-directed RNA polymerase subunit omega [Bacteroidales bacterium]